MYINGNTSQPMNRTGQGIRWSGGQKDRRVGQVGQLNWLACNPIDVHVLHPACRPAVIVSQLTYFVFNVKIAP